jgi:type II secretory pathway pseudopilin PulG
MSAAEEYENRPQEIEQVEPARQPATAPVRRARTPLRVVPEAPFAPPKAPFVALVLGLLGAGLIALLVLNTAAAEDSYKLQRARQRDAALQLRQEQLQQQVDAMDNPAALAKRAKELGMVPAGNPAFIQLPDGTILGQPEAAQPLPSPSNSASPSPNAGADQNGQPTTTTPGQ